MRPKSLDGRAADGNRNGKKYSTIKKEINNRAEKLHPLKHNHSATEAPRENNFRSSLALKIHVATTMLIKRV